MLLLISQSPRFEPCRTYDTPEQRSRMWKAFDTGVERDENKVDKILLSTVGTPYSGEPDKIENIGDPAHCPEDLMITIAEAHQVCISGTCSFSAMSIGAALPTSFPLDLLQLPTARYSSLCTILVRMPGHLRT